jgi:hypothetical protein
MKTNYTLGLMLEANVNIVRHVLMLEANIVRHVHKLHARAHQR